MNYNTILFIGAAVVALAALVAIANDVISIISNIRRNPPLPEEVAKGYATKRELTELRREIKDERERVDETFNKLFDLTRGLTESCDAKYTQLESSIRSWQLSIERLIGQIEGKVEMNQ